MKVIAVEFAGNQSVKKGLSASIFTQSRSNVSTLTTSTHDTDAGPAKNADKLQVEEAATQEPNPEPEKEDNKPEAAEAYFDEIDFEVQDENLKRPKETTSLQAVPQG